MTINVQMALVTKILDTGDLRQPRLYNILPQYLTDEDAKYIMESICDSWDSFHVVPTRDTIAQSYHVKFVDTDQDMVLLCAQVIAELGRSDYQRILVEAASLTEGLTEGLSPISAAKQARELFDNLATKYGKIDLYTVGARSDVEFDMLTTEDPTDIRIPWVWSPLQEASRGLERGEIAILYARMKNGKTFALLEQAVFLALRGYRVLIITPEMTTKQILRRIYAIAGAWDYQLFKTMDLFRAGDSTSLKHRFKLTRLIDFFRKEKTLRIFDPKDAEDQEISLPLIESLIDQHKTQVLCADQMAYLHTEKKYKEIKDKLGAIARRFKTISGRGVPVIATHQSNRTGVKKKAGDKDADDLADSDQIAQIADIAIRLKLDSVRGIRWFDVAAAREINIERWAAKADFCTDMSVLPYDHPALVAGKYIPGSDASRQRRKVKQGEPLIRR